MVCGVEAHVCVYLTTQDFLELGYTLHVVVDCTSSRNQVDRRFAYDRMKVVRGGLNSFSPGNYIEIFHSKWEPSSTPPSP